MSSPATTIRYVAQPSANRAYPICVVDAVCPHCGVYSAFEGPVAGNWAIVLCHRCEKGLMVESDALTIGAGHLLKDYHPKKSPTVDPFVPSEIAEDYLEAQRCFLAGAWHGCAVMARRCMHSVAETF